MADKPDTRHLDRAIDIFKGKDGSKRAKPAATFTYYVGVGSGTLQGPRGKTIKSFDGTADEQKAKARAYAEGLGQTITIYD